MGSDVTCSRSLLESASTGSVQHGGQFLVSSQRCHPRSPSTTKTLLCKSNRATNITHYSKMSQNTFWCSTLWENICCVIYSYILMGENKDEFLSIWFQVWNDWFLFIYLSIYLKDNCELDVLIPKSWKWKYSHFLKQIIGGLISEDFHFLL